MADFQNGSLNLAPRTTDIKQTSQIRRGSHRITVSYAGSRLSKRIMGEAIDLAVLLLFDLEGGDFALFVQFVVEGANARGAQRGVVLLAHLAARRCPDTR